MAMLQGLPVAREADAAAEAAAVARAAAAVGGVDEACRAKAYQAWLGFHKARLKVLKWDATTLVVRANEYALGALGLPQVPQLEAK
eukprot:6573928-Prymnesium_polylepis.1